MYYYDPDNRAPRRWAIVAAASYAAVLAVAFVGVSFDFAPALEKPGDTIFVDFTEPPEPPHAVRSSDEPRVHDAPASVERTTPVGGSDARTRTPNPQALFRMDKSGSDEPADAGNLRAREGEAQASGKGSGSGPDGFDQVDRGLQGRGLVGTLPRPSYPGAQSGKVVVQVTVDAKGYVTNAVFEAKGSTVSDPSLIEAALAAARKARFTESSAAVQSGTITYVFRMK